MTPLAGIKVLAVEIGAAGPWCSRMLADMGAEVVKVEPLEGDLTRNWDSVCNGLSAAHVFLNRNKKSLALNLKSDEGREIFLRLAAEADVVFENFKPGVVARLGIDYADVRAVKADIIYGHISGFGQDGPYRDEKAYDMIIQGEAGYILMTGTPEAPAKIPISVCDETAGFYAALGILGLLNRRHQSGEGGEFEVSMLECAATLLGYVPHFHWHRGEEPERTGMRHGLLTPYGPYKAGDDLWFSIAVLSEAAWRKLCEEVVEAPEFLADERFKNNELRITNRAALEGRLVELFMGKPKSEWLKRLRAAGIPCGGVNTLGEVLDHPQLKARGAIGELTSSVGPLKEFLSPIRVSGEAPVFDHLPDLGEHNEEILQKLGYDAEALARLKQLGVI
ncbi:MAG: CoA transferase [Rhodospirillaceae bacterium]|nr:CoA transferase [Rhodospirillaceae bacterium]